MSEQKKSPTQELSDLFYGLQISTKILEAVITEYESGKRSQEDFEGRFHSQIWVLTDNLKKIKPLVDTIVKEGYSKYGSAVSSDSTCEVQPSGSEGLAIEEQVQTQES